MSSPTVNDNEVPCTSNTVNPSKVVTPVEETSLKNFKTSLLSEVKDLIQESLVDFTKSFTQTGGAKRAFGDTDDETSQYEKVVVNEDDVISIHAEKYRTLDRDADHIMAIPRPRVNSLETGKYLADNSSAPTKLADTSALNKLADTSALNKLADTSALNKLLGANASNHSDQYSDLIGKIGNQNEFNSDEFTNDILAMVDSEMPQITAVGEPIPQNIADRVISHFLEKSRNLIIRKEIAARHILPSNCEKLTVPVLSSPIMNLLTDIQKRNERQFFNLQQNLLNSTVAIADIIEKTLVAESSSQIVNVKDIVKSCLDAVTLLGHTTSDINVYRKQNIRYALNYQYKELCNPSRPVTKLLLGDDLHKSMKEVQETSQLTNSLKQNYTKKFDNSRKYNSSTVSSKFEHEKYNNFNRYQNNSKPKPTGSYFLEKGKKPQQGHRRGNNRPYHQSNKRY